MICSAVRSKLSIFWAGLFGSTLKAVAPRALLLEDPLGLAHGREGLGIGRL